MHAMVDEKYSSLTYLSFVPCIVGYMHALD